MAFNFSPKTVTNGLVMYLDAANPNSYPGSETTWYDLSGNKNNVTLLGNTLPSWNNTGNGSFYFDGTTSYAKIESNSTLVIVKPTIIVACTTPVAGNSGTVMARGQDGNFYNYGIEKISRTSFNGIVHSCPNGISGLSTTTSAMNVYAVTYDGQAVQYYRNGVYVGYDTTCYSPLPYAGAVLSIGAIKLGNGSYSSFFAGNIAVVQLYNRQLSNAEIIQNQNAIKSRFN